MCWGEVASLAASWYVSDKQGDSAKKGGQALDAASQAQLGFLQQTTNTALQLTDPSRQAGYAAQAAMMDMMGLPRTQTQSPDWASGPGSNTYFSGASDVPALKKNRNNLSDKGHVNWAKGSKMGYRAYANALEEYIGDSMPEGVWEGTGLKKAQGRERPRKRAPNSQWQAYTDALSPIAEQLSSERATTAASTLPPGVTAPNLAGYEQYNWQADPSYQFRMDEGMRTADASASSRGGLLSGGALKDLTQYGQNMASQEYMNIYNRLATLAGYGVTGSQQGANSLGNLGAYGSNIIGEMGMSRASSYVAQGQSNANFAGDVGTFAGNLPWDQWMGGKKPGGTTNTFGPVEV